MVAQGLDLGKGGVIGKTDANVNTNLGTIVSCFDIAEIFKLFNALR